MFLFRWLEAIRKFDAGKKEFDKRMIYRLMCKEFKDVVLLNIYLQLSNVYLWIFAIMRRKCRPKKILAFWKTTHCLVMGPQSSRGPSPCNPFEFVFQNPEQVLRAFQILVEVTFIRSTREDDFSHLLWDSGSTFWDTSDRLLFRRLSLTDCNIIRPY